MQAGLYILATGTHALVGIMNEHLGQGLIRKIDETRRCEGATINGLDSIGNTLSSNFEQHRNHPKGEKGTVRKGKGVFVGEGKRTATRDIG